MYSRELYSGVVSSPEEKDDYNMEFRSPNDNDAWYTVRLLLEGDKLRVEFLDFPNSNDAVYDARNFQSQAELEEFVGRFRGVSPQLQDNQCNNVQEGTLVCVSHEFEKNDVRFYDGVLEEVKHREHSFAKGEEECLCKFLLCWQHGPNSGKLAIKCIADICIVQSEVELQPCLTEFVRTVKQKIKNSVCKSSFGSASDLSALNHDPQHQENFSPNVRKKSTFAQRLKMQKGAKWFPCKVWPSHGMCKDQNTEIEEIKYHIILVQNVEKELSPSTVLEFIQQQTSIIPQVCIFPSLTWESYTRAAIILDSGKDLEKLYEFLQNPDHIIISSSGRPWVVAEKMSGVDVGQFMLHSSNKLLGLSGEICEELKVVCSGTDEFKRVVELRDLFIEFDCHQQRLHKKLRLEEREILHRF